MVKNQVSGSPSGAFSSVTSGGYYTCGILSLVELNAGGEDTHNQVSGSPSEHSPISSGGTTYVA